MSVTVMSLVWATPPAALPPNQRLVLLAYADHANDDGTSVYPGEERMAEKTGYSIPSVRRITADLLAAGFLHREIRGRGGRRARYRVDTARLVVEVASQDKRLETEDEPIADDRHSLLPAREQPITGDMPNHQEPSDEPSGDMSIVPKRRRDLLWETFVEIHGEPAHDSERGKYNRIVKTLRDADVTPDEYPTLVAAYVSKYRGSQPAAATISERIGELRHYATRGPLRAPTPEEVEQEQAWRDAEQKALEE